MSYEIVKGIKIDNRNKKIFLRSSSNNVYPKNYSRYEFMPNCDDIEYKKYSLFYSILSGNANLKICDNQNWKYASYKFNEYCDENNINRYDLWELGSGDNGPDCLKKYYEIFMKFVEEERKGLFYLDSDVGYITNVTHQSFFYTNDVRKLDEYNYDYKKAYLKMKKLSNHTINKYNIHLKEYTKINTLDSKLEY